MADAVTSQTLQDGDKSVVMKFTNISSLSTCTGVSIQQVWYELNGMTVDLVWDASTDVLCWTLSGYGFFDFRSAGPLTNNSGGGKTGDLMFTTTGHGSGDRYSIMIKMGKSYE
jgi:hypothetical protein